MHRATPLTSSFRAYVAGGSRATVPEVDDTKLMQESLGNFMSNEARKAIEAPQNYGFTSVVADAMKGSGGKIQQSAETFVSFMGGNRSFPVFGNMDDRRHRLINLAKDAAKGATAMFGMKEWGQQILNTVDGIFMTGNTQKKIRFQLVDNQNGKTQQQMRGAKELPRKFRSKSGVEFDIETFIVDQVEARDGSGGGGSGGGQSTGATGQKTLHKENSSKYLEMTKDTHNFVHDQNINYKSGTHQLQPFSGGTRAGGGMLVQIFGDKFTAGLGHFMKQVTAAPPTSPMHLTTKGYVDSIFKALGITIPPLPPLPFPPLPPGVTLPPGITLPLPLQHEEETPVNPSGLFQQILDRLAAIESRIEKLENKI
jgi:phage gp45-like